MALGVETRFRALVKAIKANPNYNAAVGLALDIEGADQTPPNLSMVRPFLTATISGNHVTVGWDWQSLSAFLDICEIQVDRGAGFIMLTFDTTPGYVDTQPFPAAPAKWSYRAIYRVGDNQVGQWSQTVSVTTPA